ncbi:dephospho-CoA kinase [Propylenella binzhouense]|uniref:Dephospho-CoA kinase n=1 Tax=Propylenella binzhouense TaxID=2555902 RepID=A0A964WSC4_9HYPH|nr:dephospho-CoA kinase [Propylenella binzhouense]MYZ46822.1 dephospho-CoA kinase [Propylenella binzhouense]
MLIVGLTGSIGMGKTTTAGMFRARGIPVHDADGTVHRLYGGAAVQPVETAFPGVTVDGRIDRVRLSARVVGNPSALARLEAIVHPLVRAAECEFLERARGDGRRIVVLDIPLLFETGAAARVDCVVLVSADADVQRERVLRRPGMAAERFEGLLARQMPDREKRRWSHFRIDTGRGLDDAGRQVDAVLRALRHLV